MRHQAGLSNNSMQTAGRFAAAADAGRWADNIAPADCP